MDDLIGKALDGALVTGAKREEAIELYRRKFWLEKPVSDCVRDTGKPPIPVRWVVANKGDTSCIRMLDADWLPNT